MSLSLMMPFFLAREVVLHSTNIMAVFTFGSFSIIGAVPANNWGSIDDDVYTLPNGNSARIRVIIGMNGIRSVRLQLSSGTPEDQFPARIRLTGNSRVAEYRNPTTLASYGLGPGRDYSINTAKSTSDPQLLLTNGSTVFVELIY